MERRKTEEKEVTVGLNLHPFFNSEKKATESLKKQGFTEVLLLKGDKNMEENCNRKKKSVERRKTEEKEVTGGLNLHPFFNSEKKAIESLKKQGFTEVLLLKGDKNMEENYNRKKATDVHYCKIQTEPFSHEGRKICVVTSRRGGWKNHGVKGSGCTSQNSAEYSALKSLINQISKSLSWRDSEIGEWVILEQWSIQNPRKYEQLRTEIRKHIAWTEFENGNSRNGMISHSAMNNAIKAVFA